MNHLNSDATLCVLSFLTIPDILRVQCVSRGMYHVTNDMRLWHEKATEMILPKEGQKYILIADDAAEVVEQLLFAQEDYASQLISSVAEVSSNDREEESVTNVMSPSLCYSLKSSRRGKEHSLIPDDHYVYYTQLECGCMGNHPCYWSSAPSFTPNDEHITFKTSSSFALIQGIGITPYQAYFQPEQPVYAPDTITLQLVHANGKPYYTSPAFPVRAVFEHQYFTLPSPVVYIGGDMKLLLHGQQTRQTLSEAEGGEHHNSYYTCISHAVIGGVPIDDIRCATKAVTADTIAVALSSAYATCF